MIFGDAFLTHLWTFPNVGLELPIGTTLIFDIGVYATVVGVASTIFLALLRWQDEVKNVDAPTDAPKA